MKRNLSATSIESDDSVIQIDYIPPSRPTTTTAMTPTTATTTNEHAAINTLKTSANSHNKSLSQSPQQPLNASKSSMQTRSRSAAASNMNSTTSTANSTCLQDSNSFNNQIKENNSSPLSSVYVDDSEATNYSDTNENLKNDDDAASYISSDVFFSEDKSSNSGDSMKHRNQLNSDLSDRYSRRAVKVKYNFAAYVKEDHDNEIYCVQIYNINELKPSKITFATVGSNRCSVYEYTISSNSIKLIDSFMDGDLKEIYYTCCWTTDTDTNDPLLVAGGFKGVIRTLVPFKSSIRNALYGHGSSVNDLRMHPTRKSILLSASKDYTIRLWNLKWNLCIAILGGCEGHRDEVLSADFNLNGNFIMSCSIDHSLKMWNLSTSKITNAILDSENYDPKNPFQTVTHHFPDYSTRDVHANYIDCVRWFGDLILSKSCENIVICWKPGLFRESLHSIVRSNKNVSILYKFAIKECDIWYVRFSLDLSQKILALGTQTGKMYVWNLDAENPDDIKPIILTHPKCKRAVRSTSLSLDGKYLLASSDDGYVWVWKREL